MTEERPSCNDGEKHVDGLGPKANELSAQFSMPGRPGDTYTDGRRSYDWKSKYDPEARVEIAHERNLLLVYLSVSLILAAFSLMLCSQVIRLTLPFNAVSFNGNIQQMTLTISGQILAVFFAGSVGGTTFALKWLVHACATGKWHLDRRPWRLIVPLIGGVYSSVVLTLLDAGMFGHDPAPSRPLAVSAALAFLVGYFSDGVSGLLSNIANAVFGTLEKK